MSDTNPWATASEPSKTPTSNPASETAAPESAWGTSQPEEQATSNDWINQASQTDNTQLDFSWTDPFAQKLIPFDTWVENGLDSLVNNFRDVFQAIRVPVDLTLTSLEAFLLSLNPWIVVIFFTLFAWQVGGRKLGAMSLVSLVIIGFLGAWAETMVTLSLVFTAVIFSMLIGIPLGIWMAKSNRVSSVLMPILDAMQTTPAFVYLIPIVMLFGIGNVPGRGSHHYLCLTAFGSLNQSGYKTSSCRPNRSRPSLRCQFDADAF